jgi:hypothetical protein
MFPWAHVVAGIWVEDLSIASCFISLLAQICWQRHEDPAFVATLAASAPAPRVNNS